MIQKPNYTEFCTFCKKNGWDVDWYIIALWKHLEDRGWKKKNGEAPKSWQALANAMNGVILERMRRDGVKPPIATRKERQGSVPMDCEPFPESKEHYICYTDGSCDNMSSAKAGGAAYIVIKNEKVERMKSHGQLNTTNNRMELLAIISAINACPFGAYVDIYTDSKYCITVLSKPYKPKLNADLYELYKKCSAHVAGVRFHRVKGHNGDKYNEMADNLAYEAYCNICTEYGIERTKRH